ncbi:MAG: hypothetical protein KBI47_18400, partial [Armatimonadetes bacterium]|nr:hypothetical protein [Armatimonadota bacterium]
QCLTAIVGARPTVAGGCHGARALDDEHTRDLAALRSAMSARTPGACGIEVDAQLRQPWGVSAV